MPDIDLAWPLLPIAAGRDGVRFRVMAPLAAGTPLIAFCRGVEVGRRILDTAAPGEALTLAIARLPWVEWPAELRFGAAAAGPELAPPWPLPNEAAALALVGPGDPCVDALRLEAGVVRGLVRNRVNGAVRPVLYARLNGSGARGVVVGAASALGEGGASWPLALALEPGDLTEAGLTVTLHAAADAQPLAQLAWARVAAPGAGEFTLLAERVARLERGAVDAEARLLEAVQRRIAWQGERVDAFVEATAALLLDRVAGDAPAALRALIADAVKEPEVVAVPRSSGRTVALDSGHLALGWHALEVGPDGVPFRWMAESALIVNPEAHRAVAAVTLGVRHVYPATAPAAAAAFDARPVAVAVTRGAGEDLLRLVPPGPPGECRTVRIDALTSGVPAEHDGGTDARRLSLGVAWVAFDYAE